MAYPKFFVQKLPSRLALLLTSVLASGCSTQLVGQLPNVESPAASAVTPPAATEFATIAIPVDLPGEMAGFGGIITADVDGDQQLDFIVTQRNYVGAFSLTKGNLWAHDANIWLSDKAEAKGLPGLHGPGVQAGDIDQDGTVEILYLTPENTLEVLSGQDGTVKYEIALPPIASRHNHWEHAIIANFSGQGDRDILLQASRATNQNDYFRDSVQAAFSAEALLSSEAATPPLWINESFVSVSHGSAKVADINGDGKDEVLGATILSAEGQALYSADVKNTNFPHMDSIAIDDIDPNQPGLEIVMPEEGGTRRVILFGENGTLWTSRHRLQAADGDGDKVAIGNFDPASLGLEMWFRGNESEHFTVLNATGDLIASYKMADRKPDTWTEKGFEVIHRIRWTGEPKDYIVAKERHEAGDAGIFDALTGQLIVQFPGATERLYVADVVGDWREEVILLEQDELKIFQNQAANPNPDQPRLWESPLYRRLKMTWNYYSP